MTMLSEFHALRPYGGFDLIMADPPWQYRKFSERGHVKTPQGRYS